MALGTGITWTDATFNPWVGCQVAYTIIDDASVEGGKRRITSPACQRCYARTMQDENRKATKVSWGPNKKRRRTGTSVWKDPLDWNALAAFRGKSIRVFCASLCDIFEDQDPALDIWRKDTWDLIAKTPFLDWQLLTKRIENVKRMVPSSWIDGEWPSNVWMGTTVDNQQFADIRIPVLLEIPAPVRFLSCEPLLGELRIPHYLGPDKVSWVICAGEKTKKGGNARAMNPAWAESLRDQCGNTARFYFKQWGSFDDEGNEVGGKKSGRLLDGVEHLDLPPRRVLPETEAETEAVAVAAVRGEVVERMLADAAARKAAKKAAKEAVREAAKAATALSSASATGRQGRTSGGPGRTEADTMTEPMSGGRRLTIRGLDGAFQAKVKAAADERRTTIGEIIKAAVDLYLTTSPVPVAEDRLTALRAEFEARFAALEARVGGV